MQSSGISFYAYLHFYIKSDQAFSKETFSQQILLNANFRSDFKLGKKLIFLVTPHALDAFLEIDEKPCHQKLDLESWTSHTLTIPESFCFRRSRSYTARNDLWQYDEKVFIFKLLYKKIHPKRRHITLQIFYVRVLEMNEDFLKRICQPSF